MEYLAKFYQNGNLDGRLVQFLIWTQPCGVVNHLTLFEDEVSGGICTIRLRNFGSGHYAPDAIYGG